MESNANQYRISFVTILVILLVSFEAHGQNKSDNNTIMSDFYSHYNTIFSLNSTKINLNNSYIPTLYYDFGAGVAIENEIFYSQRLSTLTAAGLHLLRSSTETKSYAVRIIAAKLNLGGKYFMTNKIALYSGLTGYYTISQMKKDSYIDPSWESVQLLNSFQFGGFAGLDIYLYDWSSLRPSVAFYSESINFAIAFVITPDYLK